MESGTLESLFALLRYAIRGEMTEQEKESAAKASIPKMTAIAEKHDVAHLLAFALEKNAISMPDDSSLKQALFLAVYRYEQLAYEYERLCEALEEAEIAFVPLKGAILRAYYPEPWMRTSCDIDILVHREHLESAMAYLESRLGYRSDKIAQHDVTLYAPGGMHIELHFDLIEEDRANRAGEVLGSVWENVELKKDWRYRYEMNDAFFYFYHVAHMAKHLEFGGCGIRPFIDLWILDRWEGADKAGREKLIRESELLMFAEAARKLSRVWLEREEQDALTQKLQSVVLSGGVYGTVQNRVAMNQKKKGGRLGYLMSRLFVSYDALKRFYPILEKHRWLMPILQIRRWFRLLDPKAAKRARCELEVNHNMDKDSAEQMNEFLRELGLESK